MSSAQGSKPDLQFLKIPLAGSFRSLVLLDVFWCHMQHNIPLVVILSCAQTLRCLFGRSNQCTRIFLHQQGQFEQLQADCKANIMAEE